MTGCSTTRTDGPIRAFAGDQPDCFLRGTRIVTPTGAVCVEELGIGDSVVTRFSGIQPVKWIGRQSFDQRFVELGRAHIPVCIHAGALGQNMPARDLYVSPGHSMLVGHMLVLASSLVNGLTITQDEAPPVIDYFQIELAGHDCVVAEGAWSETYADGPCVRAQFHNAAEFYALYPDEPAPDSLNLCAPRPERGTELAAVLRPIVARAAAGLQPGHLHGHIDRVEGGLEIDGWAIDVSHPELPVLLEVLVEDRVIGTVLACDYRADLAAAGLGAGNCAFFFRSDIRLRPEALGGLQIRRASDGADLPIPAVMTSARLEAPPELDLALTLAA
jgi:hypothetical protein